MVFFQTHVWKFAKPTTMGNIYIHIAASLTQRKINIQQVIAYHLGKQDHIPKNTPKKTNKQTKNNIKQNIMQLDFLKKG